MGIPLLVTGDHAVFPKSWPTIVLDAEVKAELRGSGKTKIGGKEVVVEQDLKPVIVTPCAYKTLTHTQAGAGTLTILAVLPVQLSKSVSTGKLPALLQQAKFLAKFEVLVPAMLPGPPPVPDPAPIHVGTGEFKSSNKKAATNK